MMDPELIANLELDALQPKMKSIVLIALTSFESDDLFQQLLSVDSALEALEESLEQLADEAKDIHGGSEFDDEYYVRDLQSSDLVKLIGKFEELQTTLRGRFNLRAQELLQGIRTPSFPSEFPDEVLLNILNCFKSTLDKSQLYLDKGFASNIKTVQSIRLTCRRLCEISSHLLVPYMHITPTLSSLEHVDQVLSHPLISRGLRLLCVSVPILEADVAEDFNRFCDLSFDKLLNLLGWYYPYPGRPEVIAKRIEDFFKKGDLAWYGLHELRQSGLINFGNDADLDLPRLSLRRLLLRLLLREHVRYRELHQKQEEILWSDRLTRAVAAAAARSPSGICLHITDTLTPTDLEGCDPYGLRKALEDDPNLDVDLEYLIKSTRVLEGKMWQDLDVDHTSKFPQSILYELPLAICAAGATLTGFVINISSPFDPPFPILSITQEHISALGRAFKNLEAFKFRMPGHIKGEGFSSYLSAVTGARKIRNLSLGLGFNQDPTDPTATHLFNPITLVPVRILGTWGRLETLTLENCAMHLNELRGLLGVLKPGVNILFDGIELLSGTWEKALGCIRSKAGLGSQVIVPCPWDCVIMSESDYWEIFEITPNLDWGYVVTLGRARRLRAISDV